MVASTVVPNQTEAFSLEDFLQNPPDRMEWVDGQLVEKDGMTLKHGRIQAKLSTYWVNYKSDHRCQLKLWRWEKDANASRYAIAAIKTFAFAKRSRRVAFPFPAGVPEG
ncbi:MAG: hypothetical protein Fur006_28190 [Coleofasciculaceae cyanobacterium]